LNQGNNPIIYSCGIKFGFKMTEKNQEIHQFIVKEAYARSKVKKHFSTTACALEEIFGSKYKLK
jgi:hypothetical protein